MSKVYNCVNIREVWDFRLSTAVPTLYNNEGENWRVEIHSKGEENKPLESFDTGIPSTPEDNWNKEAITACFTWLRSVRDKYSLDNIEARKPVVALINKSNAEIAEIGKELAQAQAENDTELADTLRGKMQRRLNEVNQEIKSATDAMKLVIEGEA